MRSLLLLMSWVAVASAEPREHAGLQARLGVGSGYATGSTSAGDLSVDVTGVPISTEISIGTTIAPGLVVGGGTFSMIVPSPSYGGMSSGANHISGTGPFVDYYLDPHAGTHIQAALLFTAGYLQGNNGGESSTGFGIGGEIGAGYEWWLSPSWTIGPIARVTYYRLYASSSDTSTKSTLGLVVPSVLVALTYH
jgi:hypothetical protein